MSKNAKIIAAFVVAAVVLMLCACIGIGQMMTGDLKSSVSTSSPPVAETTRPASAKSSPAAVTAPSPEAKIWTAGMYKVGSEIPAGSYVTTASGHCYWERLKNDSGDFDSIIANENLSDGERGRVGVKTTDKFVKFTGDCEWRRA